MRCLYFAACFLMLIFSVQQTHANDCQEAIDEHNIAADDADSWFRDELQREFGVGQWADIDWSVPKACERILPIYREQLSRAEEVLSLRDTARGLCSNLRSTGPGLSPEERISIIEENIRLCEEVVADKDGPSPGRSEEESEEEFRAAQKGGTKDQATSSPPAAQAPAGRSRSNCSDITGTGGGGHIDCAEPKPREYAALPPPQKGAAKQGRETNSSPAAKPGIVDQLSGFAGSIIDALGRVKSGQVSSGSQDSSGASSGQKSSSTASPPAADPYRTNPPHEPSPGQDCVSYFEQMLDGMRQNAALCLRDTRLLRNLTDIVGTDKNIPANEVYITRNTAPELWANFDPKDARWARAGPDRFTPNCVLPMTVAAQNESFFECARVYLCGARAARCGLEAARNSSTKDCRQISAACLKANPLPQRMTANPSPPPYQAPDLKQGLPKAPFASKSTITGPSGAGGPSGGSGVIPAR